MFYEEAPRACLLLPCLGESSDYVSVGDSPASGAEDSMEASASGPGEAPTPAATGGGLETAAPLEAAACCWAEAM